MKKLLVVLLVILMASSVLVACGEKEIEAPTFEQIIEMMKGADKIADAVNGKYEPFGEITMDGDRCYADFLFSGENDSYHLDKGYEVILCYDDTKGEWKIVSVTSEEEHWFYLYDVYASQVKKHYEDQGYVDVVLPSSGCLVANGDDTFTTEVTGTMGNWIRTDVKWKATFKVEGDKAIFVSDEVLESVTTRKLSGKYYLEKWSGSASKTPYIEIKDDDTYTLYYFNKNLNIAVKGSGKYKIDEANHRLTCVVTQKQWKATQGTSTWTMSLGGNSEDMIMPHNSAATKYVDFTFELDSKDEIRISKKVLSGINAGSKFVKKN